MRKLFWFGRWGGFDWNLNYSSKLRHVHRKSEKAITILRFEGYFVWSKFKFKNASFNSNCWFHWVLCWIIRRKEKRSHPTHLAKVFGRKTSRTYLRICYGRWRRAYALNACFTRDFNSIDGVKQWWYSLTYRVWNSWILHLVLEIRIG